MRSSTLWVLTLCCWLVVGSHFSSLASHEHSPAHSAEASQLPPAKPTSWRMTPQLSRNSSKALPPLFQPYSPDTPTFQNQRLLQDLAGKPKSSVYRTSNSQGGLLSKRDSLPTGTCAPGTPCANGACCSNTGVCSFAPSSCAPDVCISNCNATAPCGQWAKEGEGNCPLNVCCSQFGYCGTTSDFCGKGCQDGYGSCGEVDRPSCSGASAENGRRIGYYESWAHDSSSRLCGRKSPDDIPLVGLTHLNFAFTFFDPSTFELSPMTSAAAELYQSFTGLKKKRPGLETWISLGGWSFNDETNIPNTRTAFSDMTSTSANRRKFIEALHNFMQSYGFDGIDIDWEYPAADDRGGSGADTGNFVKLVDEMRASWGTSYGISVTLPSSYWYLRGFDIAAMEKHLDWFNVMSYDIHGVWDSKNQYTGPYIRPHTNLTEIKEGLDLMWMAGVDPSKVVLGLGWYGRSFTLVDPSCSHPNGVCEFSEGGSPGPCTNSAGTLSIAEIKEIQASGIAAESYDSEAAVKWITWNNDQWVSFDDGVTMMQKMKAANELCLAGIMIWALDMDNDDGDAMSDVMGIGKANGVTSAQAASFKDQYEIAAEGNAVASSCYWSLCGESCKNSYFDVTEARGQVASVQQTSICLVGQYQTLCCAPQTTMGKCKWEGFRGVGLPCTPVCEDPDAVVVAQNSNSYSMDEDGHIADLTCTGGYQAYCCSGFVPSSKTNTGNMFLYGQGIFSKRSLDSSTKDVNLARSEPSKKLTYSICIGALGWLISEAPLTFGLSLLGVPAELALCAASGIVVAAAGFATKPARKAQGNPAGQPKTKKIKMNLGTGNGQNANSQWPKLSFSSSKGGVCDCHVTYTCRYGMGWDEVCDNQRWAITYRLNQQSVFAPNALRPSGRMYSSWAGNQRKEEYRTAVQMARGVPGARCQLDEFPMRDLFEAANNNPQVCRLVNGRANSRQGNDYKMWKRNQWMPCSSFRSSCNLLAPPATWAFNSLPGNRGMGNMIGTRFITALGFDSQTANSLCFASYSYTDSQNNVHHTMVEDHGFRVLNDDPMFYAPMNWPRQNWKIDPGPYKNAAQRPASVNSAAHMRRDFPITVAMNQSLPFESDDEESSRLTCNAIYDEDPTLLTVDGKLAYDALQFEDLLGNEIDGRSCDVIYADDEGGPVELVVREDGSVQYSQSIPEIPVTSVEAQMPTIQAQIPEGPMDGNPPRSTSVDYDAVMAQVTAAPDPAQFEYHLHHTHNRHH
ncbi:putative class V chitinase [Aspergillus steynii IBT 23096]|uniref:chitinase n=1 Tax=Aspergillus steynii IBT 23096 TaxID=1392250 RepID=A0A2I2GSE4_9EURO|nr:putative class V chitinase [Aspergillus steynii IBT 23096]PLB55790.1 putative class V chitinase [Aspergillus steynii IBT 23096]